MLRGWRCRVLLAALFRSHLHHHPPPVFFPFTPRGPPRLFRYSLSCGLRATQYPRFGVRGTHRQMVRVCSQTTLATLHHPRLPLPPPPRLQSPLRLVILEKPLTGHKSHTSLASSTHPGSHTHTPTRTHTCPRIHDEHKRICFALPSAGFSRRLSRCSLPPRPPHKSNDEAEAESHTGAWLVAGRGKEAAPGRGLKSKVSWWTLFSTRAGERPARD